MFSLKDFSQDVRSGEMVIDFVSIEILQSAANGINLEGHGLLKIDDNGVLACEFVCVKAKNIVLEQFSASYPADYEDPDQTLNFKAVDLQGRTWLAKHFSLHLNMLRNTTPFKCSFFLSEIVHQHKQSIPVHSENHLWFECLEFSRVPKNKTNTIKDSLAGESFNKNQTDFDLGEFKVSIVDNIGFTTVHAAGKLDVNNLYAALKFYIGFTGGTMPNAYVLTTRTGEDVSHHIRSINKKINMTVIPHPIGERLMLGEDVWNDPYHHELLINILFVQDKFPVFFNSTVTQWKRVWQGYNAELSITSLALTVSIEGLLIDLFIPKLEEERRNEEFEKKKEEIIEMLGQLELLPQHLESIVKSVQGWGNIHANAALTILAEKGLITKKEVKAWKDLRHSSAHPRFSEATVEREMKERKRLLQCLNLYYKLNLNIYGYEGGHVVYGLDDTMSTMFPSVDIFDLYEAKASLSGDEATTPVAE